MDDRGNDGDLIVVLSCPVAEPCACQQALQFPEKHQECTDSNPRSHEVSGLWTPKSTP